MQEKNDYLHLNKYSALALMGRLTICCPGKMLTQLCLNIVLKELWL